MIKWRTFTVVWILALALLLFAKHHNAMAEPGHVNSILDLTHTEPSLVSDQQSQPRANHEKLTSYRREFSLSDGFGTHIDAPSHYARGLWTVDQIPTERLVRPLVVINIASKARANADTLLTVEDIAAWEDQHGHIPQGAVVVLRTGWGGRWNNPASFRNADRQGVPHFPGFSVEAAQFLVDARYVVGIGTDTMSVDGGSSRDERMVHAFK